MAPLGGRAVPAEGQIVVALDPLALGVHDAEVDLRLGGAALGQRSPFCQGDIEVALAVGLEASLELRLGVGAMRCRGCGHADLITL